MDQCEGALRKALDAIIARLDGKEIDAAQSQLESLVERAPIGLHLTDYWQVAIAGEPNVGKSSLMNALVGYRRAIVHATPGTTRDAVTARTAIEGWPIEFIDTAGLRSTTDPLEAAGIALAQSEAARADLVLHVRDASSPGESILSTTKSPHKKVLPIWNKRDLVPADWQSPIIEGESPGIAVSAATGEGMDELLRAIVARLIPVNLASGEAVPFAAAQSGLSLIHI